MGQSAPTQKPRTERPTRPTPKQRRQQLKQLEMEKPLQSTGQAQQRKPTLKEQWRAKREEKASTREANAAERKRKKDAPHAVVVSQQKRTEPDAPFDRVLGGDGGGGGTSDADDADLRHAQAEAMQIEAQISAQLAAFKTFMQNNPDVEEDLNTLDINPANMLGSEASTMAALEAANRGCHPNGGGDLEEIDDEALANVSIHSSDYANEELMQGLDNLDEELEEEFQKKIEALQEEVAMHKQRSLVYLREHDDKPAALEELKKAKEIEAKIQEIMDEHETPLRVQIEDQQRKIAEHEDLIATRKQNSLTALHAGNKNAALSLLKEAKGFEGQLEVAKAQLAMLMEQRDKQLRSKGED
ncbi:hypothetical protein JKF63_05947 [Porcisia hertigi]|uniref:Uncharacterized protein n=1 Tax=Porcisia hertigi TaxID=2761500 RepID=A0A836I736_9TRYP|nr:hypothetical protein JKF63_05947 [Porcisia hertigi]